MNYIAYAGSEPTEDVQGKRSVTKWWVNNFAEVPAINYILNVQRPYESPDICCFTRSIINSMYY